jgi:hypothetical protein
MANGSDGMAGRSLGSTNKERHLKGAHPRWGGKRAGAGRKPGVSPKLLGQAAALARIVPKSLEP